MYNVLDAVSNDLDPNVIPIMITCQPDERVSLLITQMSMHKIQGKNIVHTYNKKARKKENDMLQKISLAVNTLP